MLAVVLVTICLLAGCGGIGGSSSATVKTADNIILPSPAPSQPGAWPVGNDFSGPAIPLRTAIDNSGNILGGPLERQLNTGIHTARRPLHEVGRRKWKYGRTQRRVLRT